VSRVIKNACLLVCYLAMDVLLLLKASFGNVLIAPLPSSGSIRHNILYFSILLHSNILYTQLLQSLMQLFVHQFYTSTTFSTSVFTLVLALKTVIIECKDITIC
jgi:hypothetical protein